MHHVMGGISCFLWLCMLGVLAKRTFQESSPTLKDVMEKIEEQEQQKRNWNSLTGMWGKRSWNSLSNIVDKRGWKDLSGMWDKRSWENLPDFIDKRGQIDLSESGKRDWNGLSGMWGKRDWNDLSGMWGKRGWNDLSGMWGKRSPDFNTNWHILTNDDANYMKEKSAMREPQRRDSTTKILLED
ncbi:prothoracicostatic peptide-like [Limulus polyphemus]|uniref:Prothoracicostatic peptide-like n=1 Tax=Limulus polyphemus TaxID=6850 RepID=A0ABM1C284_LIMPO|nr:prothoracicostatic peptide-like [Limulus polyphemus]